MCGLRPAVLAAVFRCWLLLATDLCTTHYAGAIEIYAPNELFVENGTYAKLPCTFKSTEVTGRTTSITWTYTEEGATSGSVVIFHYIGGKSFPPAHQPRFKDRVAWAGDINNRDVSIKIDKITFKDNGTYTCTVMNPPDFLGTPKQIKLRVVENALRTGLSEVYAPDELFVENGMRATLPCAFKSSEATSSATAIIWMFSKEGSCSAGTVVFYVISGKQYPGRQPQFEDRVSWAGDINTGNVSIRIDKITPEDNGSYSCMVLNPPDVTGSPKSIKLQVVGKDANHRGRWKENEKKTSEGGDSSGPAGNIHTL